MIEDFRTHHRVKRVLGQRQGLDVRKQLHAGPASNVHRQSIGEPGRVRPVLGADVERAAGAGVRLDELIECDSGQLG